MPRYAIHITRLLLLPFRHAMLRLLIIMPRAAAMLRHAFFALMPCCCYVD